jgi:hypothetical protein
MGKSQTFRHFVPKTEDAAGAQLGVATDWRQMVAQLLGLHRIFISRAANYAGDGARAGLAGIVVCSNEDLFTTRPTAPRALQPNFATFALPVGQRVDTREAGDAWLCDSDTLLFANLNTPIIEVPIVGLMNGNSQKADMASGSIRHLAEVEVRYSTELPAGIPSVMEIGLKAETFAVPETVTGWVCVRLRLRDSTADPAHKLSVPFFQVEIRRVRTTFSTAGLTEAAHSELHRDKGRTFVATMARVNVYFDNAIGSPALTPSIAAHIESCVAHLPVTTIPTSCDAENVYKPFSDTRGAETSLREAIRFNGVVFVGVKEKFLYEILAGRDGCGGLMTSNVRIGEVMNRLQPSGGHLYFEVPLMTGRALENHLNAGLDAASLARMGVREAIEKCESYFKRTPIEAAEAEAARVFGGAAGARGLYLWGWLRREWRGGARLVSNEERLKPAKTEAPGHQEKGEELADDWEALMAEQELDEFRDEAISDKKENAEDFAATVREVVDEVMAVADSLNTGSSVLFSLVDRRYGYDEITPEIMTSMSLTRSLSEVLKVTFQLPASTILKHPNAARQHIEAIKKLIDHYALTKQTIVYATQKGGEQRVQYPNYGVLKAVSKPSCTNYSMTVSFVPGSEDAARINALLHVVIHDSVFTYVGFRAIAPLRRAPGSGLSLKDLKYVVGKDPRCTASWTPAFAEAMAIALAARKNEAKLLNAERTSKFVSDHFVGAYSDPRGFERLANESFDSMNFSGIATIEQVDYIYTCITRIRDPEQQRTAQMLLGRRKRELLMETARSLFPGLKELFLLKRDSKDQALHERFGKYNRGYRDHVFRIVQVSKQLGIAPAATRDELAALQGGLLMDLIDTCIATAGRYTKNRANVPKPTSEGGVGARVLRLQLWTENHEEENEAEDEAFDLEEMRLAEEATRYGDTVEAFNNGIITAADRIWAIQYELRPGFKGQRVFGAGVKQAEHIRQTAGANAKTIAAALEAGRTPPAVAAAHHQPLTEFYSRFKDQELALDFLRRFVHWTSSPDFSAADLPDPPFWNDTNPMAFHNWTAQRGIRTSTAFGEIEWDREGIIEEFLDVLTVIAHNASIQRSVDLIEMDYGSYQEAHSAHIPLHSLLGRHTAPRLHQMESEPASLADADYKAILVKIAEGALIRPGGRKENILFTEGYIVPTPFGMDEIMKEHKKIANPELRKLKKGLADAEDRLASAQAGHLRLKDIVRAATEELAGAREAERIARAQDGTAEHPEIVARLVAAKKEYSASAADAAANAKELETASAAQIAAKQAFEIACRKFGASPDGVLDKALLMSSSAFVKIATDYMRANPKSIDIQAFVDRAFQERAMLDRAIYIAACRVRQYIAPPVGEPQKPEVAAPVISSRSSEISSSDLGIVSSDGGAEVPHNPVSRTRCPDGTMIITIGFNLNTPAYRPAPGAPRAHNYYGPFTVV